MDNSIDWHWFFIAIIVVWFFAVAIFLLWLVKRFIPNLRRMMDDAGMDEAKQDRLMTKTMFPPRFHK